MELELNTEHMNDDVQSELSMDNVKEQMPEDAIQLARPKTFLCDGRASFHLLEYLF
jgi:hypothetical protein